MVTRDVANGEKGAWQLGDALREKVRGAQDLTLLAELVWRGSLFVKNPKEVLAAGAIKVTQLGKEKLFWTTEKRARSEMQHADHASTNAFR